MACLAQWLEPQSYGFLIFIKRAGCREFDPRNKYTNLITV